MGLQCAGNLGGSPGAAGVRQQDRTVLIDRYRHRRDASNSRGERNKLPRVAGERIGPRGDAGCAASDSPSLKVDADWAGRGTCDRELHLERRRRGGTAEDQDNRQKTCQSKDVFLHGAPFARHRPSTGLARPFHLGL